jgi:hypothetical protein
LSEVGFYGQAMTAGDIYTIAKSGAVGCAFGIAVDHAGNVVLSGAFTNVVRVVAGSPVRSTPRP